MTEAVNQNQRGSVLVPTILGAGAGVGGYFAADKLNLGIPTEATSWEEIVRRANGDDKFISNKIEKATDAEVKSAWTRVKEYASLLKEADDEFGKLFNDVANKDSKEVKDLLDAVNKLDEANSALKGGEKVEQSLVDAVEKAKKALTDKKILKDTATVDDVITKSKVDLSAYADDGFKKIKLASKGWTAAALAAVGLLAGLGINALVKNKE